MFARHRVFVCSLPHHLLQRHRTTPYTKNSHFRAVSVQDVAVSFQGSGADPYLVGRFSNAHTSSPDASLPRPFRVIRDHSRPHGPPAGVCPQSHCGTAMRLLLAQRRAWVKRQRPHAGLGWGAGTPQGAVRITQGMDAG